MFIQEQLYREIIKVMPIPCVDLLVVNLHGEILMVKRRNEPASGQWWFPGGRVLHGETREQAAVRKLKEECGINSENCTECNTYDLFLDDKIEARLSHAITTIYKFKVKDENVVVDYQSLEFDWKYPNMWIQELTNNSFVAKILMTL